jgi:hypothetical protein
MAGSAAEILAVPLFEPNRLFSRDGIEQERRDLLKTWHPDLNKNPQAAGVFDHIQKLYQEALRRIEKGEWQIPGLITLDHAKGRYEIRYRSHRSIEIGDMYVGRTAVTFVIDKLCADLVDDAKRMIASLSYPSPRVQEQISPFMPDIIGSIETDTKIGFVVRKTPDVLLLSDVVKHMGGIMPPVHVAWTISSLLNIACYCQVTDLVLPGLDLDSIFISPPMHTTCILGGWWFSTTVGSKVKALPAFNYNNLPAKLLTPASPRLTVELIKLIGRQLLGDSSGGSLRTKPDIPKPMIEWLGIPAGRDAVGDYAIWRDDVLKASFGPRRFSKLELSETDLYR